VHSAPTFELGVSNVGVFIQENGQQFKDARPKLFCRAFRAFARATVKFVCDSGRGYCTADLKVPVPLNAKRGSGKRWVYVRRPSMFVQKLRSHLISVVEGTVGGLLYLGDGSLNSSGAVGWRFC
jgi:hypothetical protein